MNKPLQAAALAASIVLAAGLLGSMAACQNRTPAAGPNANSVPNGNRMPASPAPPARQFSHPQDASVIPSQHGPKQHTTNEFGGTTYGLGSSVYSLIGSSGLHSHGLSSHLESRLGGAGIGGVKVFAVDDMVIVATKKKEITSARYDELQQKVLSNTGGQAGKGREPGRKMSTKGEAGGTEDNNLDMAAAWLREHMGGTVQVLTVESPRAVEAIERIRSRADDKPASPLALSNDIRTLLQIAMSEHRTSR
jgi:hypothetical protein